MWTRGGVTRHRDERSPWQVGNPCRKGKKPDVARVTASSEDCGAGWSLKRRRSLNSRAVPSLKGEREIFPGGAHQ